VRKKLRKTDAVRGDIGEGGALGAWLHEQEPKDRSQPVLERRLNCAGAKGPSEGEGNTSEENEVK